MIGSLSRTARAAVAAAAGAGVLLVAPFFYALLDAANEDPPPHAARLCGRGAKWKGVNAEGDTVHLHFNRWGMCRYETPELAQKGPVEWEEGALVIKPIPLPVLSSFSSPLRLRVTQWPTEAAWDVAEVDGVRLYRME